MAAAAVIGAVLWSLWKRSRMLLDELTATSEAFDEALSARPKDVP